MTEIKFDEEVEIACDNIKKVLSIKAKEYRRNNNPLEFFDNGVIKTNNRLSREEVIYGFALKHTLSIDDLRNDIKKGVLPSRELIDEKFGDAINYLILEKMSIIDKIEEK